MKNSSTNILIEEIHRLVENIDTKNKKINELKLKSQTLQDTKNEDISQNIDKKKEIGQLYDFEKEKFDLLLKSIEEKLDINKNNLYGFLNNNEIINKNKILAITKDEVLFDETLSFKINKDNNSSFYGIKFSEKVEKYSEKYNLKELESNKRDLKIEKTILVERYNKNIKVIDESTRVIDKNFTKGIKVVNREVYTLESSVKILDNKRKYEEKILKDELLKLKDSLREKIESFQIEKKELENNLLLKREEYTSLTMKESEISKNIISVFNKRNDELNVKLFDTKKEIKEIVNKYIKIFDEKFKIIKNEFNLIKKEDNIDVKELDDLNINLKSINGKITNINSKKSLCLNWIDKLEPEINKIPSYEKELLELRENKDNDKCLYDKLIETLKVEKEYVSKRIEQFNIYKESYKDFKEKSNLIDIVSNEVGKVFTDDEILVYFKSSFFTDKIDMYFKSVQRIGESKINIENHTRRIVGKIPRNNILNLRTSEDIDISLSDSTDTYISIISDYIKYVKEKLDTESIGLQIKSLIETINKGSSQVRHIIQDVELVNLEVNKINSLIKEGVSHIAVIDNIKLNYIAHERDEITNKIKLLGDVCDKEYSIMFNNDENAQSAKDYIIKLSKELCSLLEKETKRNITVSEMSRLTFDVGQNGQIKKGMTTLKSTGSNGTTIMVKTIIYLTLLKKSTNKFGKFKDMKLHCILDEIGQISADYFTELMNFTNELGFTFLNGTASNDDDIIMSYNIIYAGTKESNGSTELREFVIDNILEDK